MYTEIGVETSLGQKIGIAVTGVVLAGAAVYVMWLDISATKTLLPTASETPAPVAEEQTGETGTALADDQAARAAVSAFYRSSLENWQQILDRLDEFHNLCQQSLANLIQKNLVQACHDRTAHIISLVDQHETLIQSHKKYEAAITTNPQKFDARAVAWYEAVTTDIFRQHHSTVRTFLEKYQAMVVSVDADIVAEDPAGMTSARRAQLETQIARYNQAFDEYVAAGEAMSISAERVVLVLPQQ